MKTKILYSLAATLVLPFVSSASKPEKAVNVLLWPSLGHSPQSFATVSYTSTNATIKQQSKFKIPSGSNVVNLGFKNPSGEPSMIATAASNLDPETPKTLLIHLNSENEVFHIGLKTANLPTNGKSAKVQDLLKAEVVRMQRGQGPQLNKPVVLDPEGKLPDKEPEKSFLQK